MFTGYRFTLKTKIECGASGGSPPTARAYYSKHSREEDIEWLQVF